MKKKTRIAILVSLMVLLVASVCFSGQWPSCALVLTQVGGTVVIKDSTGGVMKGVSNVGSDEPTDILNQYLGIEDTAVPGKGFDKYKLYSGGSLQNWQLPDGKTTADIKSITVVGRRGGCVTNPGGNNDVSASTLMTLMGTREGVVGGGGTNSEGMVANPGCAEPLLKNTLPALCPQMASFRYLNGEKGIAADVVQPGKDYFDATYNFVNNIPAGAPAAFDCNNVLKIDAVTARYDWEDDKLLWGISDEGKEVGEALGGDYSHFRYIIFPLTPDKKQIYDTYYKTLTDYVSSLGLAYEPGKLAIKVSDLAACADSDTKKDAGVKNSCNDSKKKAYQAWQYLVHLGQDESIKGLSLLGKSAEEPSTKLYNSLPGAFLTYDDSMTKKCEWLDTTFQAPEQAMIYKNLPIWDWDVDAQTTCVGMVILEGDGGMQKTLGVALGYYGEEFIQDDLVGYFTICKDSPEAKGQMMVNYTEDIDLTLSTGTTQCKK